MEKNAIIFDCIAAAAKVVFNHLNINPGNYTAADLVADCANIEADRQEESIKNNHSYTNGRPAPENKNSIERIKRRRTSANVGGINPDIYNYNWADMGEHFDSSEDGNIIINVGSFSCSFAPLSVFLVLTRFAKVPGLSSAIVSAAQRFTREECADLVPVCSFALPCPGSKLAKCAAVEDMRPVMCSVLFDPSGRLVVSDGKIMQIMPITLELLNTDELRDVIIPASIIKNAKNGEKITIYKNGDKYRIKTATESAEEIEGNYPNWQNVLKSFKLAPVATFSKKEITALQKTADKITKGMTPRLFVYNSTSGAPILCAVDFDYNKKNVITASAENVRPAVFGLLYENLARVPVVGAEYTLYYLDRAHYIAFKDNLGNISVLMPMEIIYFEEFDVDRDNLINYSGDSAAVSLMATAAPDVVATDTPAVADDETTATAPDVVATDAPAVSDEETTAAAPDVVATDTPAVAYDETTAAAPDVVATDAPDVAATVTGDKIAGPTEEEETAAPTMRPARSIRAALWIHKYAAAIVAAIIPLFVLYVITKTEIPATAAAPAALVADMVAATDAPATASEIAATAYDGITTADTAEEGKNALQNKITTAPATTAAAPATATAEDHAPALSPDDLAAIYAAYLAAASSPDCGPVLSSPATTAAATAVPAVDVAAAPGDTAPGDTLPAPVLGL